MSEEDVRDGMRVAVADEPPFAFDPELWISTANRQSRRRRALVSVGVATTAIAVAAVAVPVGLGLTGNGEGYSAGAPPTVSSAPRPDRYTAAELTRRGERMAATLRAEVPLVLPGATDVAVGKFGGEAEGAVSDGQNYLNAFVGYTFGGARYAFAVSVYAPAANAGDRAEICAAAASTCQDLGLRDGGQVLLKDESNGQMRILSVYHLRDDGSVVSVAGYNYDPTSEVEVDYRPTIPLTVDQLLQLAVDENLGL
jgi:hypothetical protein